jgi:hypothetical protein
MGGVTLAGTGAAVDVITPVAALVVNVGGDGGGPRNSLFKAEQDRVRRVTLVTNVTSTM